MLMQRRWKFRKQQRGRMRGKAWARRLRGQLRRLRIEGDGSPAGSPTRQIEAARVAMTRFVKRGGKIWIRVFPDKPITKKPQETRMGKGKGAPEQWSRDFGRRPGAVRDGGHQRDRRASRHGVGGREAPHQDPVRDTLRAGAGVTMMKPAELRELSVDELRQREHDLEEQLFRARFRRPRASSISR